jgi:triose-phosphate isomerase
MKKLYLNQKTYLNKNSLYDFILNMREYFNKSGDIVIIPSMCYLSILSKENIVLGSQNIAEYNATNQTGEVTGDQLNSLGVEYAIIGHSERRNNNFENNHIINNKIRNALSSRILPILCVGENKEEKNYNQTFDIIKKELLEAIKDVNINKLVVAYEPIWSIGTGNIPSVEDINKVVQFIKSILKEKEIFVEVLYGGSVNASNILELSKTSVDGFLLGSSSTNTEELKKIIEIVNKG